ncbi:MAG: discoidin domain-containing protein [Chitinophagaceae bacterium]|nr:discoidin domain-containing protein [Chitinophagaceae bacterium]
MKKLLVFPAALLLYTLSAAQQTTQPTLDALYKNFLTPPATAKPRVWWHWMNGNITQDGIASDLKWMKRSGIGGFQNFDAALMTPQIVEKRLTYMTPEWKSVFAFTAKLADSLQLEMAIAGSPGWSESGGPWVKAEDGMKKIVWSEKKIKGGKSLVERLSQPPSVTGTFQNIPLQAQLSLSAPVEAPPQYYRDIAVIAYKIPDADVLLNDLKPVITSSAGSFNLAQLTDGDLATTNLLPSDSVKGYAWIQFAFEQPQTIKAITIVGGGDKGPFGLYGDFKETRSLEASDDGQNFTRVCYIPAGNVLQQTISIPATAAKYFRVTFKNPPPLFSFAGLNGNGEPPKAPPGTGIAELVMHTASRIHMFEEKAAFSTGGDFYALATPASNDIINENDIIDISNNFGPDAILRWDAPEGNWNIVRYGFSLTGKQNHPASPEATGLEVDKLDAAAVKAYFTSYLDQYKSAANGLMGSKGLQYIVTDSWEAGTQNWTNNLPAEFQKRRGYNLMNWMPVLTGRIIKSAEASERFLWDFRKTLAELVVENHYDQLTNLLKERGMKRYSESHESGRALIADGMDVKRTAAIPMAAMWTPGAIGGDGTGYKADIRESASVAHIYGQNITAAESLTAIGTMGNAWSYSPEKLKPTADLEMASGLNRFVIHTSVHQPVDDKIPGLGLGPFGQWFNRHETWAEQAKAWTDYLARSCYLLQQGKFVADIVYYYGEDNNITSLFGKKLPAIPEGYNYDFINSNALLHLLAVNNNKLVTPGGMQYTVLVLDSNSTHIPLKVLQKIQALVNAGAIVAGPKPVASTGLQEDNNAFIALANQLWGDGNAPKTTGSGKVYGTSNIQQVLDALQVSADFEYSKPDAKTQLLFVHRKLAAQDIYWINSRTDKNETIDASFRITGKSVELWYPETGRKELVSYTVENGYTKVSLHLTPNDAVFVVFGNNSNSSAVNVPAIKETPVSTLDESWKIDFQKDRGAPASISVDKLQSFTENNDNGVKYFSGIATYTKTIDAAANWFKQGAKLWIDLGDVKNIAEVFVNGKSAGIVWKKPFKVDISSLLKPGKNTLTVKVTNLWVNRLIGDQQPGVDKKITYTTMPFYKANSPLLPSGLLGPVQVISAGK